jgi:hypothetical protein
MEIRVAKGTALFLGLNAEVLGIFMNYKITDSDITEPLQNVQ